MPDQPPQRLSDSPSEDAAVDPSHLSQQLQEAFDDACFAARVDAGHGETLVSATLLNTTKAPFLPTPEQAAVWLDKEAIDASARFDDACNIAVDLRTAESVERLIRALLEPHIRAYSTAIALQEALTAHKLAHTVRIQFTKNLELALKDSVDSDTAPTFARLLGAPHIDAGLDLTRDRHLRRLADRLTWLTTGITGCPVHVEATTGCAHEVDRVTLILTLPQARRLTHCLDSVQEADTGPVADEQQGAHPCPCEDRS
jgi:hypothetical protein